MRPNVTYVLPFNYFAGGVAVVLWHAGLLRQRGWDVRVVSPMPPPGWWTGPDPGWVRCQTLGALGQYLRGRPGVKVATFTPNASWVWENLLDGDRGFVLFQDFDGATYQNFPQADYDAATRLRPITESLWVTAQLKLLYGESVNPAYVGIGVNPVYRPLPMIRERLRVFTPARTASAGRADLKGYDVALGAVRRAADAVPGLSLVTFGLEDTPTVGFVPHIHVRSPNDRALRELYCQAGVVLIASRHEGFGLVQLEAMACAAPVVCTDAEGNRELCQGGDACLVAPPDDPAALGDTLVRVVLDAPLADRLGAVGYELSRRYRWHAVIDRLEALYGE